MTQIRVIRTTWGAKEQTKLKRGKDVNIDGCQILKYQPAIISRLTF